MISTITRYNSYKNKINVGKITNNSIEKVKENYLKDKENTTIKTYELYIDKYGNTIMNLLVNSGDITYNDTVKIN